MLIDDFMRWIKLIPGKQQSKFSPTLPHSLHFYCQFKHEDVRVMIEVAINVIPQQLVSWYYFSEATYK